MINTLEVINSYGEKLVMALRNPEISGYIISGISGLGPVDVDIKQTQFVSGLKYRYNKGFHKYREITLSIIFNEWNSSQNSIDYLRLNLIKYFKTNDNVTLNFIKDDGEIRKISGWVSKHSSTYFSNSCGAEVVITCPDPWFIKVIRSEGVDIDYTTTEVSPIYTTENNYYIYSTTINYEGDVQTSFRFYSNQNLSYYRNKGHDIFTSYTSIGYTGEILLNNTFYTPEGYNSYNLDIDVSKDFLSVIGKYVGSSSGYSDVNLIGWVDFESTVSKNKNLPILYKTENQNTNTLTIKTNNILSPDQSTIVGTVYHKNLYRGL